MRPLSCETSVCNSIDKTSTAWIAARIFYKWFVCFLICCCFFVLGSHSAVHSHLNHPFFLCIQVVLQGEETVISKQLKVKIGKRKFCKEFHGHHSARGDLKTNLPRAFKDLVWDRLKAGKKRCITVTNNLCNRVAPDTKNHSKPPLRACQENLFFI